MRPVPGRPGRGRRRPRSRRAFTLVEAMVSFLLMLIILGQVATIQDAARRLLVRVRSGPTLARQLADGYRIFARDCMHFQVPGFLTRDQPVVDLTQIGGDRSSAKVSFYAAEYVPVGMQEIRLVTYTLEGSHLVRRSSPAVESNQGNLAPERTEVLVREVTGLAVKLGAGGRTWISNWAGAGRKGIPQGLLLTLSLTGEPDHVWARMFGGAPMEGLP